MRTTINLVNKTEINRVEMVDFYNEATEDYEYWSKDFNMHFGYFIPLKANLFRRDSMLSQMNNEVVKRLSLKNKKALLTDLGCGIGGTKRYVLKKMKNLSALGVTLSDFQVKKGNELF